MSASPGVPAPLANWSFIEPVAPFAASTSGTAALAQGAGSSAKKVQTPFGPGIQFNGTTDYLRIPAAGVGALNVGASTNAVTIAAWVFSTDTNAAAIAGCWHETTAGRQRSYALFTDLPTYGGDDLVCMNVSKTGGTTPGYLHSIDYAANPKKLTRGVWQLYVGTYDGARAIAYLNGSAEPYPAYTDSRGASYSKNPYAYPAGLNPIAADFVVGASLRNGKPINLHKGSITRLRVWDRALTPPQIAQLYAEEKVALDPPSPRPVPVPIASWDFAEAAAPYASSVSGSPSLTQGSGSSARRIATPFGGGVEFNGSTDYLQVVEARVGKLNVGASTNAVTVVAWVYSTDTNNAMIAGCWQESNGDPRRSYALFNDLPMYGGEDMVCMEVSKFGGATPGYPFSIDYAAEPRKMTRGVWQFHAGTYDGAQAVAYLNGVSSAYPSYTDNKGATYARNPYLFTKGLSATPVEFNVGAVVRDGKLINLHKGRVARLRVWDVALDPDEIRGIYEAEKSALG